MASISLVNRSEALGLDEIARFPLHVDVVTNRE